ncbi:PAS domain-containing protein [bacterium]|nr:PAS domain-containing protein [bacterium]
MSNENWFKHFPGAITVTDENTTIILMNDASAETFKKDGGRDLIGKSVMDCHPDEVREKVQKLYEAQEPNTYIIEKHGKKKLVYQTPYFKDGILAGVVEMSLPLPENFSPTPRKRD